MSYLLVTANLQYSLSKITFLFVPIILMIFGFWVQLVDPIPVQKLRIIAFDQLQKIKPRPYKNSPVKIIDIDEETIAKYGQWPWSRSQVAKILKILKATESPVLGFDILFAEPDRLSPKNVIDIWDISEPSVKKIFDQIPDPDLLFSNEMEDVPTVLGLLLTTQKHKTETIIEKKWGMSILGALPIIENHQFNGVVSSLPLLEKNANGQGFLNTSVDHDGVIRRVPLVLPLKTGEVSGTLWIPSFAAELARVRGKKNTYQIKAVKENSDFAIPMLTGFSQIKIDNHLIPTDKDGSLYLWDSGHVPERYISAWKLFEGKVNLEKLNDHIFIVGTSASGLKDIRATPLTANIAGVEVHVQVLEQIFNKQFLERPDWIVGAELVYFFLLCVLTSFFIERVGMKWSAPIAICAIGFPFFCSWVCFFKFNLMVDPVFSSVMILFLYLVQSFFIYLSTEKRRKETRNAFAKYLSPDMVNHIADNPESLKLGGEKKDLSLLFCDVRGFTKISEAYEPEELTRLINRLLTPLTEQILIFKGTVDKYMGDCVMAFWNAPLDDPSHGKNACKAALDMLREVDKLNTKLKQEYKGEQGLFNPLKIGIGINTGECVVGNMGSEQRFDYSVLGDSVNLAARFEGQSKSYGVDIIIGGDTAKLVSELAIVEIDRIRVKGKTESVTIFALIGDESIAVSSEFVTFCRNHEEMMTRYRNQDWVNALNYLGLCEQQSAFFGTKVSGLYGLFNARIRRFQKDPPVKPGRTWDGIFEASTK